MTPVEGQNWLIGGGLVINLVVSGVTAIWVLGRGSGRGEGRESAQGADIARIDKAHSAITADVKKAADMALTAQTRIDSHEDECGRRYEEAAQTMRELRQTVETSTRGVHERIDDLMTRLGAAAEVLQRRT